MFSTFSAASYLKLVCQISIYLATITEFKTSFLKLSNTVIKLIVVKNFDNNKFRSEILKRNFSYTDLRTFKETVFNIITFYD